MSVSKNNKDCVLYALLQIQKQGSLEIKVGISY